MDDFSLIPINEAANQDMLAIQKKSPIHANGLTLYFDKSPDLFALSRLKYEHGKHTGFFQNGQLKGFGSLGLYDAYVQQKKETVFTMYNFYLLPEARGKKLPGKAVSDMLQDVKARDANFGIALTMKGNRGAESYIGNRSAEGIPITRVMDEWVNKTILFATKHKNSTNYRVRNATPDDIPQIVRLLDREHQKRDFGLIYTENSFMQALGQRKIKIENYFVATDQRGDLKGVCLAWDCNHFKRTTVLSYSPAFYPLWGAYRCLEKCLPMAPFPSKGRQFNELTVTDWAVADRDPVILHALLSEIYYRHHNKKYHFMHWASCGTDPLLVAAKGFWHKDIVSHLLFTSLDPHRLHINTHLPYIDIAFL